MNEVVHFFQAIFALADVCIKYLNSNSGFLTALISFLIYRITIGQRNIANQQRKTAAREAHANMSPMIAIGESGTHAFRNMDEAVSISSRYEFYGEDMSCIELKAYLDSAARLDSQDANDDFNENAINAVRFVYFNVLNAHTNNAYGFAKEIVIKVKLVFPRFSAVNVADLDLNSIDGNSWYILEREITVPFLLSQGHAPIIAFNVTGIPIWLFEIDSIGYKDFHDVDHGFAIGVRGCFFRVEEGIKITVGFWEPLPGEVPS